MRSVPELVEALRREQIELWVEEGTLRYRAPKGALTPALRQKIQECKPEIVAALRQTGTTRSAAEAAQAGVPRTSHAVPRRMSFAQERIWFLYQLEGPSSTYNVTPVLRLQGALSVSALEAALTEIVRRHEILRTRFASQDGVGVQIIEPPAAVALPVIPVAGATEAERMRAVERIVEQETRRPFDLETGPLLRISLLRLQANDHVLLLFMHHIVSDGWSLGVFLRELGILYQAFREGCPSPLPELPIQYADFAAWQRAWMEGDAGKQQLDYWCRQLERIPTTLELPLDHPRPPVQTFHGSVLRIAVDPEVTAGLRALGKRSGASLFMTLMAGFAALLFRYTGQDELVIGTAVANRSRRDLEPLIGCFVNTLALCVPVADNPRFPELLARVRKIALEAYDHADVPIEAVIDRVLVERDPSRTPVYQVQLSLQNVPVRPTELQGLRVQPLEMGRVSAKNDLLFLMEQTAEGLKGELEYNTDLFDRDTVSVMGERYCRLLAAVARDSDRRILEIPLAEGETGLVSLPEAELQVDAQERFSFEAA